MASFANSKLFAKLTKQFESFNDQTSHRFSQFSDFRHIAISGETEHPAILE